MAWESIYLYDKSYYYIHYHTVGDLMILANSNLKLAGFKYMRNGNNEQYTKMVEYFIEQYCSGIYYDYGDIRRHQRTLENCRFNFWFDTFFSINISNGFLCLDTSDYVAYGYNERLGYIYPIIEILRKYNSFSGLRVVSELGPFFNCQTSRNA